VAIEHNAIADGERHEPKGIASATANQVYIADGAGSGSWSVSVPQPHGWIYYKDGDAAQTFGTSPSKLTLDGATSILNTYAPSGVADLWDTTNDLITPAALGDSYVVRLDLPITARSGSPNKLTIQLDIGGLVTISNSILTEELLVTGTAPYNISTTMSIFTLTDFLANGGQFFLNVDTGSVDITEPAIFITRTSGTIL